MSTTVSKDDLAFLLIFISSLVAFSEVVLSWRCRGLVLHYDNRNQECLVSTYYLTLGVASIATTNTFDKVVRLSTASTYYKKKCYRNNIFIKNDFFTNRKLINCCWLALGNSRGTGLLSSKLRLFAQLVVLTQGYPKSVGGTFLLDPKGVLWGVKVWPPGIEQFLTFF